MSDAEQIAHLEARLNARLEQIANSVTPRGSVEKAIDIAVKVMLVLAPALGGVVYGHANRITALENSTVSADTFQAQMAAVNEKIVMAANGPQWLRDSTASINAKLDVMRDNMAAMSERIVRVETAVGK